MPTPGGTPGGGRFVVGVDFGTTFTSVAFAHSSSPNDTKLIQTWPNGTTSGESADQVPTQLHYTALGDRRIYLWGHKVPSPSKNTQQPLRWFKLLLQSNPQSTNLPSSASRHSSLSSSPSSSSASCESMNTLTHRFNSHSQTVSEGGVCTATPAHDTALWLRQLNVEPRTVVSDFLKGVRKVAVQSMENTYSPTFVAHSKREYLITVPAIWSDAAKNLMVRACTAAGFGRHGTDFQLVSEPEAAAAHTLQVVQPHELRRDDVFIICDAGGGTVDLISYKIRSLEPRLEMDEVVSGSGDLCGSVYLDERFGEYIRGRLGEKMEGMSRKARGKMERSWVEEVKFRFGESKHASYEVAVPGVDDDDDLEIEEGYHTMSYKRVQDIFDPIVKRIIKLVDQQVRAVEAKRHTVAAILLVGGFGSSKYLHESLQRAKYGKTKRSIGVMQPVNAKTAIARGALLRGLTGSAVLTKRSRLFYGVTACQLLGRHPAAHAHAFRDKVTGNMMVPGCLTWYVRKEDILSAGTSHSFDFQTDVCRRKKDFVFVDSIYATGKDQAPRFKWEAQGEGEVFRVGRLRSDLSRAPREGMERIVGENGKRYYRVNYSIKMTMVGEMMRFELMYEGRSYGEVELDFERME